MNALKGAIPRTNFHDSVELQKRLLARLGTKANEQISGSKSSVSDHLLLAALPVAIYTTDADGRISYFNEAAATLWGQRPLIGTDRYCGSWRIMAAGGASLPHDRTSVAIALRTGKDSACAELITIRPDGSRVAVAPFTTLLRDANGKVTGAIVTLVDLTASKATEAALHEIEAHSRNAFELSPQMQWTADPQGRILEFSGRWLSFIGKSRDEALRSGWQSVVNPDDLARVFASMQDSLTQGKPHDVRYRVRTASGEERWVRSRSEPRQDADGKIIRWYGATEDIHDAVVIEEEACAASNRLNLISEAVDDIGWDMDLATDTVTWSTTLKRRFGVSPDGMKSDRAWWLERIHPEDRARMVTTIGMLMSGSTNLHTAEYRFRRADGSYANVLDRGTIIRDDKGRVIRAIGAMLDRSEHKIAEEALRLSKERFRLAAAASGLGVADIDMVTGEKHWSTELRAILGVPEDAVAGPETYMPLVHVDERAAAIKRHNRDLRGEFSKQRKSVHRIVRPNDGATRWLETDRHPIRNDEGAIVRLIITTKDITEEKTGRDRIKWAATHDAVTGLPNRSAFQAQLDQALTNARREAVPLGLLLIDLDNFKAVNDSLGHQAGDRALAAFAQLIAGSMPPGAVVFRFGGDEFAAILPQADTDAAAAIAGVLIRNLLCPVSIGDRNIDLRASIGVAAFPCHGEVAKDLVQNADLALFAAKADGRSTVRKFEPALRASLKDQLTMLSNARGALDHGWIRPFYQPKVSLKTGRAEGFEALLRWRDPKTGLKLPATIACAFDDTELASQIGEAMQVAVLADMRGWIDRGIAIGKIAINASAAEFREPGFAERLLARMASFDVPPAMLELEITETAFLGDCAGHVVIALETLRDAGMTIALDDFGTGFSSLSHLRNFPVDTIKIDRSFVAGLGDSAEDRAIIEAILRLGHALGMTTVAEGVETPEQADYLRAHRCALAQGFLFAPAIDAVEIPGTLIDEVVSAQNWLHTGLQVRG